ncbi:hypothetical protein [Criblamydia sequanensis]|uniref:Uncharacterized protein n=1 Tax=Candidatus Criblamydia sequanensis CRIB-18 TaxID=1437425 RepID=A0A090D0E6_9BACT|nr:hypothetical protein [Criblamydia sequanensis]CDR33285.1 hypothetical protein CSEC_0448 [Criblamydia sequanensis CRIB-18]
MTVYNPTQVPFIPGGEEQNSHNPPVNTLQSKMRRKLKRGESARNCSRFRKKNESDETCETIASSITPILKQEPQEAPKTDPKRFKESLNRVLSKGVLPIAQVAERQEVKEPGPERAKSLPLGSRGRPLVTLDDIEKFRNRKSTLLPSFNATGKKDEDLATVSFEDNSALKKGEKMMTSTFDVAKALQAQYSAFNPSAEIVGEVDQKAQELKEPNFEEIKLAEFKKIINFFETHREQLFPSSLTETETYKDFADMAMTEEPKRALPLKAKVRSIIESDPEALQQLEKVTTICHLKMFKAQKEQRELNEKEISDITQALSELDAYYGIAESEEDKAFREKTSFLANNVPYFIQLSKQFVTSLDTFQYQKDLEEFEEGFRAAFQANIANLFNEKAANSKGKAAALAAKALPDMKNLTLEQCYDQTQLYLLGITLRVEEEREEFNEQEISAFKEAFEALIAKVESLVKMDELNAARLSADASLAETEKAQAEKREKHTKKLAALAEEVETKSKELSAFNSRTAECREKDAELKEAIENLEAAKKEAFTLAESTLKNKGDKVNDKGASMKETLDKTIESQKEAQSNYEGFIKENFTPKSFELGKGSQEALDSLKVLNENLEGLMSFYFSFADHMEFRIKHEKKSSGIWSYLGW